MRVRAARMSASMASMSGGDSAKTVNSWSATTTRRGWDGSSAATGLDTASEPGVSRFIAAPWGDSLPLSRGWEILSDQGLIKRPQLLHVQARGPHAVQSV